ncbi:MAG TPA: WD40 repeat domain-containing protein [Chthoniobacteraceae bacterium]|jgi:WD40 repeat protein|nr:WD40 repeat domain-containing protein [Chthoniobacteraceae bacterium]
MAAEPKLAHIAQELTAEAPLIACRFDPTGKYVFATSQNRSIYRWELAGGKRSALAGHDSWAFDLAVTADGQTLISAGGDDTLIWWPAAAEAPEPARKVKAHDGWIRCVGLSPDGQFVASGGNDRMVRLWNATDGAKVREFPAAERDIYALRFHPSGEWLLAGDLDGKIHQWEVATGKLVRSLDAAPLHSYNEGQQVHYGGVRALVFSPDAKTLVAGGLTKATNPLGNVQQPLVMRFDWESGKTTGNHTVEGATGERVWSLEYLAEGLFVGCLGGTKNQLAFWKEGEEKPVHAFLLANSAHGMSLSADALLVATTHHDGKLRITKLAAKG